jgi:hypothetical protein
VTIGPLEPLQKVTQLDIPHPDALVE